MGARGHAHPSFGMTLTFQEYRIKPPIWQTVVTQNVGHTKRRMGARGRAHPSFGRTPTFKEYDL